MTIYDDNKTITPLLEGYNSYRGSIDDRLTKMVRKLEEINNTPINDDTISSESTWRLSL